jgi:hypothetical protein
MSICLAGIGQSRPFSKPADGVRLGADIRMLQNAVTNGVWNKSDMSAHLHTDAAEELKALPPSPLKDEALAALEDIRESKERTNAFIGRPEATQPLSRRGDWFSRMIPWLAGLLAVGAAAIGIEAIWTSQYCSWTRTSVSCTRGLKAQFEGGAIVAIGLLIATVPVRSSFWKWLAAAFLGVLTYGLVIASLLS